MPEMTYSPYLCTPVAFFSLLFSLFIINSSSWEEAGHVVAPSDSGPPYSLFPFLCPHLAVRSLFCLSLRLDAPLSVSSFDAAANNAWSGAAAAGGVGKWWRAVWGRRQTGRELLGMDGRSSSVGSHRRSVGGKRGADCRRRGLLGIDALFYQIFLKNRSLGEL